MTDHSSAESILARVDRILSGQLRADPETAHDVEIVAQNLFDDWRNEWHARRLADQDLRALKMLFDDMQGRIASAGIDSITGQDRLGEIVL